MKPPSIRWKLVIPTLSLAALTVAALVWLLHVRTENELARGLERNLATKCEEVQTVLHTRRSVIDLGAFLDVETKYSSSHEYFYEIRDGEGRRLLASSNLGDGSLGEQSSGEEFVTRPHPRSRPEWIRNRS